jgi:hypothetical protein
MARVKWTPFDVITLIAWLDFCLARKADFEKTIIQRLKESRKQHTGREFTFTVKQVSDKLIDLSRKDLESGGKAYPRLPEILSKGSVCFPRLAKELEQEVARAIKQLEAPHAFSQPQTARVHPSVVGFPLKE